MAKTFTKLTRPEMRKLPPGGKINEHGITFEKSTSGDGVFTVNIMVDGQRIHRAASQCIGKSLIGQLHIRPGKGQDIQPVVGYAGAVGVEIIHAVDQRLNDLLGVRDGEIADLG